MGESLCCKPQTPALNRVVTLNPAYTPLSNVGAVSSCCCLHCMVCANRHIIREQIPFSYSPASTLHLERQTPTLLWFECSLLQAAAVQGEVFMSVGFRDGCPPGCWAGVAFLFNLVSSSTVLDLARHSEIGWCPIPGHLQYIICISRMSAGDAWKR